MSRGAQKASRIRLAVTLRGRDDSGRLRCILSFGINQKNDLLIDLYSRGRGRAHGTLIRNKATDPEHGESIVEYRYSIHPSDSSQQDINTIKLTRRFRSGKSDSAVVYTSAIKSGKGFTPIFAKRFTNLAHPDFDVKPGKTVNIGDVSRDFTLFASLLVSAAKKRFNSPQTKPHFFNVAQVEIGPYRLVLLYSFFSAPMHEGGMIYHTFSQAHAPIFPGWNETECINWTQDVNKLLVDEFLRVAEAEKPPENFLRILRQAKFFNHGTFRSQQWQQWWQSIVDQGLAVWDEH